MFHANQVVKYLEAYAKHLESIPKTEENAGNLSWEILQVREQIRVLSATVSTQDLRNSGGEHVGYAREWMQRKAMNGSDVTWGSHPHLEFRGGPPTVHDIEELAVACGAAAINDYRSGRVYKIAAAEKPATIEASA